MRVASLAELERDWSIDDVDMANDVLDALEAAEAQGLKAARQQQQR